MCIAERRINIIHGIIKNDVLNGEDMIMIELEKSGWLKQLLVLISWKRVEEDMDYFMAFGMDKKEYERECADKWMKR